MAYAWRMSKLGGGGGINCVATSDDGSIQAGIWITTTATTTCTWSRISASTIEFGTGGGARPRPGTGGMADSAGDYSFIVSKAGSIYRYNWATSTYTANIESVSGTGEGLVCDPDSAATLYVISRSGVFRITNATSSPAQTDSQVFTSSDVALGGLDIAVSHDGQDGKHIFIAAADRGIWRSALFTGVPGTGLGWTNITGSNMRAASDWNAIDAVSMSFGTIRVAVGCSNPRQNANGAEENYFYADTNRFTDPSWTCFSIDDSTVPLSRNSNNKVINIDNTVQWAYLAKTSGGANGNNNAANKDFPQASTHGCEDIVIERDAKDRIWCGGQQGVWRFDADTPAFYAAHGELGVTANAVITADPNSSNHVYVMNTDHGVFGTADGGITWRKNENPDHFFNGETAGFELNIESGVSISHSLMCHGARNLSGGGGIYFHDDPMDFSDWTLLGFTAVNGEAGDNVPIGLAANRATFDGTVSRVVVVGIEGGSGAGGGFYRGVLSTAVPPTVTSQLVQMSGSPSINYGGNGHAEHTPIVFLTDDHVVMMNKPSGNIYYCRNATTTGTPSCVSVKTDSSMDETTGAGYMSKGADSDTMFFSFDGGTNKGVWKVTGWDTATAAGDLTWTAINKPSGTWNRPGCLDYSIVNGTGRLFVTDQMDRNGSGSGYPSGCSAYISTTAAGTTLTDITDDTFRSVAHNMADACQTPNGSIYISNKGPGVIEYSDPTVIDPGGSGSDTVITDPEADSASTANIAAYSVNLSATGYASGTRVVVATWSGDGDGADVPTMSDTIGTSGGWTTHGSVKINADGKHVALHSAVLGGSAANGVITSTYSDNQTGAGLTVLKVVDDDGIAQTKTNSGTGGTASLTFTSAMGSPRSSVIAVVLDKTADPAMTFPSGYTISYQDGFDGPATGISMGYIVGATAQSIAVSGVSSGEWGIIAIELTNNTAVGNVDLSWVELQAPDITATTQVSWVELEAPEATGRVDVSFVELETTGDTITGNVDVSFVELEAPDAHHPAESSSSRHYWKQLRKAIREGVFLRDPRPRG
jgi:hypothetical protein